jgi:hypothetical protein
LIPPTDWIGPVQNWREDGAEVLTPPAWERRCARVWSSAVRRAIEAAFAALVATFGLTFPHARNTWGLLTRLGAKIAAYNVGMVVNRQPGRPDLALAILIVRAEPGGSLCIKPRVGT